MKTRRLPRLIAVITLFSSIITAFAGNIPDGYYTSAEGKSGKELKTALFTIISRNARDVGYGGLYGVYTSSDVKGNNQVWDIYSTCTFFHGQKKCGNYTAICDCYNREHGVPQSWFDKVAPMVSDAFHVYPTDGYVNGKRGSYPYGETSKGSSVGANALGKIGASTYGSYRGTVFEPNDEYKGDLARTYFYFVTRYENKISGMSGESLAKNTYPSLQTWAIDLFLKWHRQDPVSQKEKDRNYAIHSYQYNRNPFIDDPTLAEYIWGNKMGEAWYFRRGAIDDAAVTVQFSVYPNPAKDFIMIETATSEAIPYELQNLSGQTLVKGITHANQTIPMTEFCNGIYLLKLTIDKRSYVQKVVVAN